MKSLAFAVVAAIGAGNPNVSSAADKPTCAAAAFALSEVRAQVTDAGFIVLGTDDGDVRLALDRDHFAEIGDPAEGFWGEVAPSAETAELFLKADSTPAVSACAAVRQVASHSGIRIGSKAERDAARLNRPQKSTHGEVGAILSVQTPILNHAKVEALVSVRISYPGVRAGSGWVYLLRRHTDGSWRLADKKFAYGV